MQRRTMENIENKKPLDPKKVGATQSDWEQWSGNWIWRAVQCLVESSEFQSSPKWIANRLNISIENAVEAIEGLERLGCIERRNLTFVVSSNWLQLNPESQSRKRLLSAHSRLAPQLMSKISENDSFTTQFLVSNDEIVKEFAPKFMKLFKEMDQEGKKRGCSDVVASEISFVQLTAKTSRGLQ